MAVDQTRLLQRLATDGTALDGTHRARRTRDLTATHPGGCPTGAVRPNPFPTDLWQRRFWERAIRDEEDYAAHVNYCHINPVKHGYVQRVAQWPHSTFHRYVERGVYPLNWANGPDADWTVGERT
jgi:hypothetical protein